MPHFHADIGFDRTVVYGRPVHERSKLGLRLCLTHQLKDRGIGQIVIRAVGTDIGINDTVIRIGNTRQQADPVHRTFGGVFIMSRQRRGPLLHQRIDPRGICAKQIAGTVHTDDDHVIIHLALCGGSGQDDSTEKTDRHQHRHHQTQNSFDPLFHYKSTLLLSIIIHYYCTPPRNILSILRT